MFLVYRSLLSPEVDMSSCVMFCCSVSVVLAQNVCFLCVALHVVLPAAFLASVGLGNMYLG